MAFLKISKTQKLPPYHPKPKIKKKTSKGHVRRPQIKKFGK